jgi:IclR family KDG regulon transcriptional repressor
MPIIQSVDRALQILDLFDEYETELKITEISKRLGLHKSTVHSLLKTLQSRGYIIQDPDSGKYRLGLKLMERGNLVLQGMDLRNIAKKILMELSLQTGLTVHLVILDGKEGVYIDKVEGASGVVMYSRIGRRVPIHSSAVGKVLVAFKQEQELTDILSDYVYTPHTPNTITNETDFLNELATVRIKGYAVDDQENERGVRCIAAPIWDHTKQVIAAISVSTPVSGHDDGSDERIVECLKIAAGKISEQLGYGFC